MCRLRYPRIARRISGRSGSRPSSRDRSRAISASPSSSTCALVFCAECTEADAAKLSAQGGAEPSAPTGTPIAVTDARYGKVSRVYISTKEDHVVSPALQEQMYTATPVQKVFTLDSGHTPALSHPRELAAYLEQASR